MRTIWNRRLALLFCAVLYAAGPAAADEADNSFSVSVEHLQATLTVYQEIEKSGGWPKIPDGPALRVGAFGPTVLRLKERLAKTRDLRDEREPTSAFDDNLAVAVKHFQRRHGLDSDGVVGRETRGALNVPVETRVRQLAANLNRLKSLPPSDGKPSILINVAAFELSVVEDDRIVFTSPVIVGRLSRPTPVLSSAITRITVNPHWYVPRPIAVKDILPKVLEDPSYLSAQSIRVYRASDAARTEIPASTIDWRSLNRNNFPYALVQDPGPMNALGRVKFFLPNDFDIYLHDTPAQALFNKNKRAFSSGCIRVSKALELARYLLIKDRSGGFEAMTVALAKRETRQISLKTPVPLHIVYLTAWADKSGRAQFREDLYSKDNQIAALEMAPAPVTTCSPVARQGNAGR